MISFRAFTLGMIASAIFCIRLTADDWPQWRGPNRDGIWHEKQVVEKFAAPELSIRWRAAVAGGYSGPTVAQGRVYVTDRVTSPDQAERVHCFDAMTGRSIWSYSYECDYRKVGYPDGPRAAPAIDDGRVYSLGTMGRLFCFDAAKGDVIWNRDLKTQYDCRIPIWGIAASPLVEAGLVIVNVGGKENACLIAFDKVTGKERWRALADNASYSAPIIIEQAGKRVLVCWTGERVVGLEPSTGRLYWEYPFEQSKMVINIATPVFENDYLFLSSFYDGSLLLKVDRAKLAVRKVWRRKGPSETNTDSLHCCISTPLIQGDYIYGVDSHGELRCLDLATGDRLWESLEAVPKARWSNIHMVRNGTKIWMFNERGELIISRLSPEGFDEISRARLIEPTKGQLAQRGGVCWAHPAYAYRRIYIRSDEELVCADLSEKTAHNDNLIEGILDSSQPDAGLCVHLGTSDAGLEMKPPSSATRLVHGLAMDDKAVAAAGKAIREKGLYPLASVETVKTPGRLPYANSLVSLLAAPTDGRDIEARSRLPGQRRRGPVQFGSGKCSTE